MSKGIFNKARLKSRLCESSA